MPINSKQFNTSKYAVPMYKTAKAEHSWCWSGLCM